jgi:hypothetical protein
MSPPESSEGPGGNSLQEKLAEIFSEKITLFTTLGVCVLVMVIVIASRFSYPLDLPAKPPRPAPVDPDALRRMDFESPAVYQTYLEQDSATYGVRRTLAEEMTKAFPYENSSVPRRVKLGAPPIDTGMLEISAETQKLVVRQGTSRGTREHIVLRVKNKLDVPVAYRVQTALGVVDDVCRNKAALDQNAFVIPPRQAIMRTECTALSGVDLHVTQVESMALPPLSGAYVSRLIPDHLGLPERTSAGHKISVGKSCGTVPQQTILIGMGKGTVSWRDVVDFYARHRCETYDFPVGYRAFTSDGQHKLPVSTRTLAPGSP